MKDVVKLILDLANRNVQLYLREGKLRLDAPDGVPVEKLALEIRPYRQELINYLSRQQHLQSNAIPVLGLQDSYALSAAQRRLWIWNQLEAGSAAYHIPGAYRFEGKLELPALEYALATLIRQHEILRTVFRTDDTGQVRQFIMPAPAAGNLISYQDLRGENDPALTLSLQVQQDFTVPFNLHTGPLLRTALYQLSGDQWVFTYLLHHIISDAWSMDILIGSLMELYNDHVSGQLKEAPALTIQYKDFAAWQQDQLKEGLLEAHQVYWQQQLAGPLPVVALPADKPRPALKTYNGGIITCELPANTIVKIRQLCQEQGATLFMGLLAAVNGLIYKYTGQEDIIIGSPVAGRGHPQLEDQIGLYLNTLALRTRFSREHDYKTLLGSVRETMLNAWEHQAYPFDLLLENIAWQHDRSHHPLFDVLIDYHDRRTPAAAPRPGGLLVSGYRAGEQTTTKFDLTFMFIESENGWRLQLEYNSDIFLPATIQRMQEHFAHLLSNMAQHPTQSLQQLSYIGQEERHQVLTTFNTIPVAFAGYSNILQLWQQQVGSTPDAIAITFGDINMTYAVLDHRSNLLADHLRKTYAVKPADRVALLLDRSEQLIITLWAVLKCGAAYVPVDPAYPAARKQYILEDSAVQLLITQTTYLFDLDRYTGAMMALDLEEEAWQQARQQDSAQPATLLAPTALAYIIYTSGSTGMPKGCCVTHANLSNYIQWANTYYFNEGQHSGTTSAKPCFGLYTSLSFDLTVTSIYCPLTSGGRLVIFPQEAQLADIFSQTCSEQMGINSIKLTPSHINFLKSLHLQAPALQCAIVGGEAMTREQVSILKSIQPGIHIYNEYGPTETTVGCVVKELQEGDEILIGNPIANTTIYILNEVQEPCAIGIPGEICIGGTGVAQGYWNNSALTAAKFPDDPFRSGERMYRTGDLGKWLPNGELAFLGRRDEQVKIRGYRIEMAEVENALVAHPHIMAAAVDVKPMSGGESELVAYCVSTTALYAAELRGFLANQLPAYMIPSSFVALTALPLTENGKIDKKQLPDPAGIALAAGTSFQAPRTSTEKELAAIWSEILALERISLQDDFFQAGGHSLKATRLAARIQQSFHTAIELKDLFIHTVLEDQARFIEQIKGNTVRSITPVATQPGYSLSSAQRRLWLLSQLETGSVAYHITGAFVLEGQVQEQIMAAALNALIERHEILRTVFDEDQQGNIVQIVCPPQHQHFLLAIHHLQALDHPEQTLQELLGEAYHTPFDLRKGPLLRVQLYQLAKDRWVLSYTMHHIISDGWSMNILTRELMTIYRQLSNGEPHQLPPLSIQYKDYAAWQQSMLSGEEVEAHGAYWIQQFSGDLPRLELFTGKTLPARRTHQGSLVQSQLSAPLTAQLRQLTTAQGATLFMGLLAAVKLLLYRYTGQEDIIVGTPVAGRGHADLENQIGVYVNTLALRTRFSGQHSFLQLLQAVKEVALDGYNHQAFPFDELVDKLQVGGERNRNPLFDILVDLQQASGMEQGSSQGALTINSYQGTEIVASKFDLSFEFNETDHGLNIALVYNLDYCDSSFAVQLLQHLVQWLATALTNPQTPLASLDYLGSGERDQLLYNFNERLLPVEPTTLAALFTRQVVQNPHHHAVVFNDHRLTYSELNTLSGQLAAYLQQQHHILPGDRVGMMLERSECLVVVILGILKAGAAWVPIDPAYPQERIDHILADSDCKLLVDEREWSLFRNSKDLYTINNGEMVSQPEDLAYIIYTSGSTGMPKGVMVSHASVVNLVLSQQTIFRLTEKENIALCSSISFDASVEQLFIALATGACVTVIDKATLLDPAAFAAWIRRHGITHLHTVPAILKTLPVERYESLQRVIAGGDICSKELAAGWAPFHTFYNEYGPTETTVTAIEYQYNSADTKHSALPIGRPLHNTFAYILDEQLRLQPVGVPGELYIGGEGVAMGYVNNPALTAEKFIPDPFREKQRMYRTGDRARWLPDGNMEFIGRKDHQVKVRGYRIELGEIESAILRLPGITETVVWTQAGPTGELELTACIIANEGVSPGFLRTALAKTLPAYMLPHHIVQMEALPLTAAGKIDRKQLLQNQRMAPAGKPTTVLPRNEAEKQLVAVWEEVLKRAPIDVQDDFFLLGGDSIKSIQVVTKLRQRGYAITVQEVLTYPVVEQLAARLRVTTRIAPQTSTTGAITLGPIQRYFFQTHSEGHHHFNQSVLLSSRQSLAEEAIRAVMNKLLEHHDALRMVYYHNGTTWIQDNKAATTGKLVEVIDTPDDASFRLHCDRLQAGFDLANGPLVKAALLRHPAGDRLLVIVHHLVVDGVSWRILLEDFMTLYNQYIQGEPLTLPLKTDSFQYWMQQQQAYAASPALLQEEPYWNSIPSTASQPLPLARPQGSNLRKDAVRQSFQLTAAKTEQLLTRCYRAYHTGINDVLLTAFGLALQECFAMADVLLNLEGHGREALDTEVDISRTVGWFTTIYPVAIAVKHRDDVIRQLIEVKETLHRIPNKGIGYGILRYLSGKPYNHQPEITFNYLGDFGAETSQASPTQTGEGEKGLFDFSGEYRGQEAAQDMERDALLEATAIQLRGQLQVSLEYSLEQWNESQMVALKNAWQQNLVNLIDRLSAATSEWLTPVDLTYKDLQWEQVQTLNKDNSLEDVYSLSPLQEGLYFHWKADPQAGAYFEQMSYRLYGHVEAALLEKAYRLLVARHAILRTSFTDDLANRSLQVVRKDWQGGFAWISREEMAGISIEQWRRMDREKGFNLHEGSQMRLTVLQLAPQEFEFIWSHHHILMDGWCINIIVRDFFALYQALSQGEVPALPPVPAYADYIQWLGTLSPAISLQYWKQYLSGVNSISSLPRKQSGADKAAGRAERSFVVAPTLHTAIKKTCAATGITENIFFQAAWALLLSKYNYSNDIVFGTVVSGRPAMVKGVEEMVGLFINTIPVRIQLANEMPVKDWLKTIQQQAIATTDHHYIQLAQIQAQHQPTRELFDHILQFQNVPVNSIPASSGAVPDWTPGPSEVYEHNNFDFTCIVSPGEQLQIAFRYNQEVYDSAVTTQLEQHLLSVIRQFTERPESALHNINCLTTEEENAWAQLNDTVTNYPKEGSIAALFELQVSKTPDAIALTCHNKHITYKALNNEANRLAAYLLEQQNLQPQQLVGIMLDRSDKLIISILAVLKAGGAYVPIDPDYPAARRKWIIEDTSIRCLITDSAYMFDLDYYQHTIFAVDVQWPLLNTPAQLPVIQTLPTDLAYIMYTSGSTGRPKGVMIEQHSVVRLVKDTKFVTLTGEEVLLSTGAVSFDATTFEYWGMLLNGGRLVLCDKAVLLDEQQLAALIRQESVTTMWFTAGWFHQLVDKYIEVFQGLHTVLAGGDQLSAAHIKKLLAHYPAIELINGYGPTENTTFSLSSRLTASLDQVPIGRPISNSRVYITDAQGRLCAPGIAGEICVAGDGLARGYLNNPELTALKFIEASFLPGERLYRTGDLGRWQADGQIVFLGRIDDQVKIRGYRVEPGEIAAVLQEHPAIASAVVIARDNKSGEKELVAYIVATEPLEAVVLPAFLGQLLPAYMLPLHYVQLEEMPLTLNGKVDRKRLPAPEGNNRSGGHYIAPRTPTETTLALIWEELLGVSRVGVEDNFFDLGGHSLKATRLASQIHKEFGAKVSLRDLFKKVTLQDQAAWIDQSVRSAFQSITPVAPAASYPLSSSQRRLWILSQLEAASMAYNIPGIYFFEGDTDLGALRQAFDTLLQRHESLRTVFVEDEEEGQRQRIIPQDQLDFNIAYKDLRSLTNGEAAVRAYVQQQLHQPFSLDQGPLLRVTLYRLQEEQWLLAYVIHHIICDGWSMTIMLKELLQLYEAYRQGAANPLAPLRIQYKDYVHWQQEQLTGTLLETHRDYWKSVFSKGIPRLDLSLRNRPPVFSYRGHMLSFMVRPDIVSALLSGTVRQEGTLFTTLLLIVKIMLFKYTGARRIMVGTSLAGRNHPDLEHQIGLYLNNLPLVTELDEHCSVAIAANRIKHTVLQALQHQVYPLDKLVEDINYRTDRSRPGLFNVLVDLQTAGTMTDSPVTEPEAAKNVQPGISTSMFDLCFEFRQHPEAIEGAIIYNTDLFDHKEIILMKKRFLQLAANLAQLQDWEQTIGNIEWKLESEKDSQFSGQLNADVQEFF